MSHVPSPSFPPPPPLPPFSLASSPPVPSAPSSPAPSASAFALPPPGPDAPAPCEVPHFAPVRVRGGRYRLRGLVRHRRRALAAGLAVTAAALVAAGPRDAPRIRAHPDAPARTSAGAGTDAGAGSGEGAVRERRAAHMVTAAVRIADGATVRLLRPGDRVDVVAADGSLVGGGRARVVARGARVTRVPEALGDPAESGALVVLSVPRGTAARLAGAGATARLAVTVC